MMQPILDRLRRSSFVRAAGTMVSGTVLAQAIPFALAPILTRIYPAASYGDYAVFGLAAYTVAALSSLRYEMAMLNAGDDAEASSILALSIGLSVCVGVMVSALVLVLRSGHPDATAWYGSSAGLCIGPMAALIGAFQALNYWQLRRQQFRAISVSRVARAGAVGAFNVVLGFAGATQSGLIWSSVVGQAIATAALALFVLLEGRGALAPFRLEAALLAARRHKDFAVYAVPADLLSTFTAQAPLAMLAATERGHFAFTMTLLGAPVSLLSGTLLDVFKERASRDYRERGNFRDIFVKLFRVLAVSALIPTVILLLFAPRLFGFVFGEAWRQAGESAQILALMFGMKMVASPLSYAYFIVERQKEDLYLHAYIALSTMGIFAAHRWVDAFESMVLPAFSLNYVVFYGVFLMRSWSFARTQRACGTPLRSDRSVSSR